MSSVYEASPSNYLLVLFCTKNGGQIFCHCQNLVVIFKMLINVVELMHKI